MSLEGEELLWKHGPGEEINSQSLLECNSLDHLTKDRVKPPPKRKPSKELLSAKRRQSLLETRDTFYDVNDNSLGSSSTRTSGASSVEMHDRDELASSALVRSSRIQQQQLPLTTGIKISESNVLFNNDDNVVNNMLKKKSFSVDKNYGSDIRESVSISNSMKLPNPGLGPRTDNSLIEESQKSYKRLSFTERLKSSSLPASNDFSRKFHAGSSIAARLNSSTITPARRSQKSLSLDNSTLPRPHRLAKSGSLYLNEESIMGDTAQDFLVNDTSIKNSFVKNLTTTNGSSNAVQVSPKGSALQLYSSKGSNLTKLDLMEGNITDSAEERYSDFESPELLVTVENLTMDLKKVDDSLIPLEPIVPLSDNIQLADHSSRDSDMLTTFNDINDCPTETFAASFRTSDHKIGMEERSKLVLPNLPVGINEIYKDKFTTNEIEQGESNSCNRSGITVDFGDSSSEPKYGSRLTVKSNAPGKKCKRKQSDGLSLPVVPPLEIPGQELNDEEISKQFKLVPPPPPDFESDNEVCSEDNDVIDPPTLYNDSSSDCASDILDDGGTSDFELDANDQGNSLTEVSEPVAFTQSELSADDLTPQSVLHAPRTKLFSVLQEADNVPDVDLSTPMRNTSLDKKDVDDSPVLNNVPEQFNEIGNKTNEYGVSTATEGVEINGNLDLPSTLFRTSESKDMGQSFFDSQGPDDNDGKLSPDADSYIRDLSQRKTVGPPARWSSFSSDSSCEAEEREDKLNLRKLLKQHSKVIDGNSEKEEEEEDKEAEKDSSVIIDGSQDNEEELDKDYNLEDLEDRLSRYPVEEWSVEDVGDWLEITGISDLRRIFADRQIDGRQLLEIDLQLLDEMKINDPEDREMILSEIYALKYPDEGDFEVSLLDALDNTSGVEHEKLLALLDVLKATGSETNSPSYLPSTPSPVVSPRNEIGTSRALKLAHTKAATIESRSVIRTRRSHSFNESGDTTHDGVPLRPSNNVMEANATADFMRTKRFQSADELHSEKEDKKDKKGGKKKRFLSDAFSFRRKKGSKLSKIFKSGKMADPSFKAFVQSGAQGIIKIFTDGMVEDRPFLAIVVSVNTTVQDVIHGLVEKMDYIADERIFQMMQCQSDKVISVPDSELKGTDCPLMIQCRWPDVERYYFRLQKKVCETVKVSFESHQYFVDIAPFTTGQDVMQLVLRRQFVKRTIDDYNLVFQDTEGYNPVMSLDLTLLSIPHQEGKPLSFFLVKNGISPLHPEDDMVDSLELAGLKDTITALNEELNALTLEVRDEKQKAESERLNAEAFRDRNQILEDMVKKKEDEIESLRQEAEEQKETLNKERQKVNEITLEKKKLRSLFDDLNEKAEELEDENEKMKRDSGHWKKIAVSQDRLIQDIEPIKAENESLRKKLKDCEAEIKKDQAVGSRKDADTIKESKAHINRLEQGLLEKDSKLVELEFAFQRKDRELVEAKEALDDLRRVIDRSNIALEEAEEKKKELSKRVDNYKRLVMDKDKQLQALKLTQGRFDESKREELSKAKTLVKEKETLLDNLRNELEDTRTEASERASVLQELITEKDVLLRETEMKLTRQNEDLRLSKDLMEGKLDTKEQHIKKLEEKVKKLETMTRENLKKFEKFMSDKDRVVKEVRADAERDIEALRTRLREAEDQTEEKEKQVRQLQKACPNSRDRNESRLRKMEEENKQQRFLLERLLGIVNSRDPRILKEFEESFEVDVPDKEPLVKKEDEWC